MVDGRGEDGSRLSSVATAVNPARPHDHASVRRAAQLVAAAIRTGRGCVDEAFDGWLPAELRSVSERYWTPLPVIRRAAVWLREMRVHTVVDIGSGAGKFCVATAILAPCRFVGLEQRASLVDCARTLAGAFAVDDRVTFLHGDLSVTPIPVGDAYYLFNPFGEYAFDSPRFEEPGVAFTAQSYARDVRTATRVLALAPVGTLAITYNGFGGSMPRSYEQVDVDRSLPRSLRLWRKRPSVRRGGRAATR